MPNQIYLLKQLLLHLENYEKEVGNDNLKEFSIYLKDKVLFEGHGAKKSNFDSGDFAVYKSFPEVEFSTLLTGLFRFAKHYIKKAFQGTSLRTLDEFGFLATLLKEKSLLKNELINSHILEISSGSEILKRLIKNGLVEQGPDEKDKRAKRVWLSQKGIKEIMMAFNDMHKVSEIIIGNLNEKELTDALGIFNKLTYFHQHIHEDDKNTELNKLHSKYVSNAELN